MTRRELAGMYQVPTVFTSPWDAGANVAGFGVGGQLLVVCTEIHVRICTRINMIDEGIIRGPSCRISWRSNLISPKPY